MIPYVLTFTLGFLCVPVVEKLCQLTGLQDFPNHRSLHKSPIPRGGGAAVLLTFITGLWMTHSFNPTYGALIWLCIGIALIGLLDDFISLGALPRFIGHNLLSLAFLVWVISPDKISIFDLGEWSGPTEFLFLLGLLVWSINLYNFMDGSDGLAASQALFVSLASFALTWWTGHPELSQLFLLLGLSLCGFLVFNWSPARIFMGDIGSGFLGFTLTALALIGEQTHALPGYTYLILSATFIADATLTLGYRVLSRQKYGQAHRSHMYQKAILKGISHKQVAIYNLAYCSLWLLPLATLSIWKVELSLLSFLLAYSPLIYIWYRLEGGKPAAVDQGKKVDQENKK